MKLRTKLKLAYCHNICDEEDRSTGYMIQFMQQMVNVGHDTVMNYLSLPSEQIADLRKRAREIAKDKNL